MGKKRIAFVDEEGKIITTKKQKPKEHQKVRVAGLRGGQRVVDMGVTDEAKDGRQKAEARQPETTKEARAPKEFSLPSPPPVPPKPSKAPKIRGKTYQAARTKVDPTKLYSIEEAIKLVKQVSLSKFNGSVDAHFSTHKKGLTGEVNLPYFKGKIKKVAIADEKLLKEIKSGKIDFDILLATKDFMPHLVPYAKILGPKGLMPNPQKGTILDEPAKAIKKFQTDRVSFKTERDQSLIHLKIGQVSQPEKELVENLKALITAIGSQNIKKLTICPTMGPGVKVEVS